MKKSAVVAAAQAALDDKSKELNAAKEVVQRLEMEWRDAVSALRKAQEDADLSRPNCRLVCRRWRSDKEEDAGRVVILRQTPSGILVVRRVGDGSGIEYRFKWQHHSGLYRQAEKSSSWTADTRELRDVPAQYMPQLVEISESQCAPGILQPTASATAG